MKLSNITKRIGQALGASRRTVMVDELPGFVEGHNGASAYLMPVNDDGRHDVSVTPRSSMTYADVWRCVDLIATAVAGLDWHVYERVGEKQRRRATEHPAYRILHDDWSEEVSSFDGRAALMHHVLLWGRAGAEITWDSVGRPAEIHVIEPWRWAADRTSTGDLYYLVDGRDAIPASNFLHIRGLTYNGIDGLSVIAFARHSMRLGLGAEAFGNRLFANDTRPSVVLTWPGQMTAEIARNLKDSWMAQQGGASRGRPAVLEGGAEVKTIGIPPEDAQFLETRKFQRAEVANWFSVPVQMLNDTDGATYNNAEQKGIEFVQYGLMKWVRRLEAEVRRKIIADPRYYSELMLDSLIRADTKTRFEAYGKALQHGWITVNEVRALQNMNPVDGGDTLRVPLNMTPIDEVDGEADPNAPEPQGAAAPQRKHVAGVANQIERHLIAASKAGQGKRLADGAERREWARGWAEQKAADMRGDLLPTLEMLGRGAAGAFDGWLRAEARERMERIALERADPEVGDAETLAEGVLARMERGGDDADDHD